MVGEQVVQVVVEQVEQVDLGALRTEKYAVLVRFSHPANAVAHGGQIAPLFAVVFISFLQIESFAEIGDLDDEPPVAQQNAYGDRLEPIVVMGVAERIEQGFVEQAFFADQVGGMRFQL